jgi:Reverse transcriptase (RNA-dependent DNA polymerase)/gag-polypeptide of LTR copia-type/Integrase core domain/GAG-pre-integrase domain
MSSNIEKITITKLKGAENYEVWALRTIAYLTKEGLNTALITNDITDDINSKALSHIQLLIDDGPLLQIQHIKNAFEVWNSLKNLYSPKGFSSEFLICRDFFDTTLEKYSNKMEEYLNKIKQLSDQLKAKNIELPKQVIIAWVLNNLTDNYDGLVSNITQSLRNDINSYNLENLFSNLLDESKRQDSKELSQALYSSNKNYKGKKPYKITKGTGKYCRNCKKTSHNITDCAFLFPDKAPKGWKDKVDISPNKIDKIDKSGKDIRDENIDALYSNIDIGDIDMDIDLNLGDIQVNITSENNFNNNTNNIIDPINTIYISNKSNINSNNFNKFVLDTAATKHIICNKEFFSEFKSCNKVVNWGQAKSINIKGIGSIYIRFKDNNKIFLLKNCLYMPELGINLISQSEINSIYHTIFTKNNIYIRDRSNKTITKGDKINGLYYLNIRTYKNNITSNKENLLLSNNINKSNNNSIDKYNLHQRFGHISLNYLDKLLDNTEGYNKTINNNNSNILDCEICIKGKFTNKINKLSNNKEFDILEKISSDLCGPITPFTYNKYKYFITFLDKKTRFLETKLLRTKDEAYKSFIEFKELEENKNSNNKRIKILSTDNGKEYINYKFKEYLINHGITHQLSPAYSPESNGIIERINRTLINKVRCLLFNANLPNYFWGEALLVATYLYNRSPHNKLNYKTPYEAKYNKKPNITNIRTFGSIIYYKNKGNNIKKLDIRANKGILIGYNENIYKIWDIIKKKVIWSKDIKIIENQFINNNLDILETNKDIELDVNNYNNYINNNINNNNDINNNINNDINNNINNDINNDINNNNNINNNINNNTNNDINNNNNINNDINNDLEYNSTQSSNTIDNDIDELALIVNINNEPNTYKQAINSIDKDKWIEAMKLEYNELKNQNTWSLMELPNNRIALKGKWVYKYKTDLNNNITKYKARWVVKGFDQILGIDYLDTFSTTCRPETYRIIFIIALYNKWNLYQYDIKNAFVHADIDKEIYMEQPIGFESNYYNNNNNNKRTKNPNLVCKLNKALYGLKQSPRLWYKYLLDKIKNLGFIVLLYDEAIFIHKEYNIIIICYVDDLIITGPNKTNIDIIITQLSKVLKVQYIGLIHQFLGMEFNIDYNNKTMLIHQNKYLSSIKKRFNKENLTPVLTPIELGIQLDKNTEQANKEDIKLYQQQVGSLIYLSYKTRPDITYAINKCARYMSNPNYSHFKALDRIWKYLNKYPNYGTYYNCNIDKLELIGYTDADWGGDITSRKSTSGYIYFINNNIISWNSTLQKTTALSSCEAEYMAYKDAIKEVIYLSNLKSYFDIFNNNYNNTNNTNTNIPYLFSDSESAIKLANNPEFHKRSKHIDITYHFIRDVVVNNKVRLEYINTKRQIADGFTKGLDNIKHQTFIKMLNLRTEI